MRGAIDSMTPDGTTIDIEQYYQDLWGHIQPESSRRLLLSALDSFAAKGFEAASTREIADGAGMSPAALYVYYRTKRDLLFEITRTSHERNWEGTHAAVDAVTGARQKLAAFVDAFVIYHARYHTLARVANYELHALTAEQFDVVRKIRRNFQREVEGVLVSGNAGGDFDVEHPHDTARAILSLGIDVARWYTGEGSLQPGDLSALYVDLVLRMVGARAC
jgi:AcrR family transcriptional regulator